MSAANQLATKASRAKLAVRRNPYFLTLEKGCALGFRRGPDTWIARYLDRNGDYQFKSLGEHAEFTDAKKEADAWWAKISGGGHRIAKRGTIADAGLAYVEHLRDSGRPRAAEIAMNKLTTCLLGNPEPKRGKPIPRSALADVLLEEAVREDFHAWRKALTEGRQNQTVNRYVGCLVAAMNCAINELSFVGNAQAWMLKDLAEDQADGDTAVYLTPEERARLTAHLPSWMQVFVQMLDATGARPHEIAKATVADYDARQHSVTLRWMKGHPPKLRARSVALEPEHAALFKAAVRGKLPGAPLCTNVYGEHVTDYQWGREISAAIIYANQSAKKKDPIIPVKASAYSYRHTRISELLQIYGIDPLTVANQTGTSLAMMEKYYWKFLPNSLKEKFAAAKGKRK